MSVSIERLAVETGEIKLQFENGWPVLYLITLLKKIVVTAKTEPAGKVDIRTVGQLAFTNMPDHWNKGWIRVISPIMLILHVQGLGGRFPISPESTLSWDQGFYFGIMIERLRQKHGIIFDFETYDVTPDEMKQVLSGPDEDEDDEEI